MTDEQRMQLVREILEQLMTDQLSQDEALTAIAYVMDTPEPYASAALAVRLRVAHLGD